MPKISFLTENSFVQTSDPRNLAWEYPYGLKKVKDLHFAIDSVQPGIAKFGLFKSDKLKKSEVVTAQEVKLIDGQEFGLDIKYIPIIETVSTVEEERGKGYASALYEAVFNKYKILISDEEIYTKNPETVSGTLKIWIENLSKLGNLALVDIQTKEVFPFDVESSRNDPDMRFCVISDQLLNEDWKKRLKGAALGSLLGVSAMGAGAIGASGKEPETYNSPKIVANQNVGNFQDYLKNQNTNLVSVPKVIKPPSAPVKSTTPYIDIGIISDIESGGKSNKKSNKGARGICQILPVTWKEETKKVFGKELPISLINDPEINQKVADHYYNETIPEFLKAYKIPVNYATILASYNWGITRVRKSYNRFGSSWYLHAPDETKFYIDSYKNLADLPNKEVY